MKSKFLDIINAEKPTFIDFHATWCGPCKAMEPIITAVAKEWVDKVKIIKIDIDKNPSLANKLNIKGVPTFVLYKAGQQLWRQSGMLTKEGIRQVLEANTK